MVSQYGYATTSDLETFTSEDYSVIDAAYTATVIESWITTAERLVNGFCGSTWTTIPDSIKTATLMIAQKIARNKMIEDKHVKDEQKVLKLLDDDTKVILEPYRNQYNDEKGIWVIKG